MAKNKVAPTKEQIEDAEAQYPEFQTLSQWNMDLANEVEMLVVARKSAKDAENAAKEEAAEYGARLHEIMTDPDNPVPKFGYQQWLVAVREGTTASSIDAALLATTLVEFGVDADIVASAIAVATKGGNKYEYVDIRKRKGPFYAAGEQE